MTKSNNKRKKKQHDCQHQQRYISLPATKTARIADSRWQCCGNGNSRGNIISTRSISSFNNSNNSNNKNSDNNSNISNISNTTTATATTTKTVTTTTFSHAAQPLRKAFATYSSLRSHVETHHKSHWAVCWLRLKRWCAVGCRRRRFFARMRIAAFSMGRLSVFVCVCVRLHV